MRKLSFFLIAIFLFSLSFGFQVNLDPSHLDVTMKSEGVERKTLTLSNSGKESLRVKVYLNDWTLDKSSKTFLSPGSTPYSLKNNLKIFPSSFVMGPNESKSVAVSFTSRKDDPLGQYGVVFFEVQPLNKLNSSGVSVGGRIGTLISKERDGKQKRQLQIVTANVKVKGNQISMSLLGQNPTAFLIRPKVNVLLTDDANQIVYKGTPKEWTILPNSKPSYSVQLPLESSVKLSLSPLTALITIDLGNEDLMLEECKVVIE